MIQRESNPVGVCPNCTAAIPPARVLIEYESGDETRQFAECPDCREVVDPDAPAVESP